MKKILILLFIATILFSGCVGVKTVKIGDNISVDYIGSIQDGKVFDTSIEQVAKENNLLSPGREYTPYNFTVGKGKVVKGFDEGVIGMKVGETRTLTIPPEKGYGPIDLRRIQAYPVIQVVPSTFPRVIEIPISQFESTFGTGHKKGDIVSIPRSDTNMTVQNISENVSLSYNFKVGEQIPSTGVPWNTTVIKVDDKNITVEYSVKKNQTFQFENVPWNTTVIGVTNANITLRHNPIPETDIETMFGLMKVRFNETSIIMDQNNQLAGKTLVFKVTLKSIN
ncbi:MAG: FKBP-type peptidyl-prolyl cis-trans isomerase [Candidatus Methanoperedens sp.]|nr:FKBP-type peptidyl-prolyl cis-trans isomerase [Candidatus Methanoperedens sp.]MCZ7370102.1 FKBP-type peptidyl-prolyl cis-trans isomerase [Candidatus Methanoperedens sp.]